MTRDLRTLIYLLNLELREECSRTLGPGMQSGSSSRSGRNRGAADETDAIGKQLKRTQSRAAAEVDASGEQQLKRMQDGSSAEIEADRGNRAGSSS